MRNLFLVFLIGSLLTLSTLAIAEVEDSLVLYLSFDEGKGEKANDLSDYKNHATLHGAQWTSGKFGQAVKLNGSSDFVEVPFSDSLNIDPEGELTIAAWVNVSKVDANWGAIVVKGPGEWNWGIYKSQDNKFMVGFHNQNRLFSTTQLQQNVWCYVTAIYGKKDWFIYVDGNLENTLPMMSFTTSEEGLSIGKKGTADQDYFGGIVDEFRIWKRALDEKEIQYNMESGHAQFLAVSLKGKLTVTWGEIKAAY